MTFLKYVAVATVASLPFAAVPAAADTLDKILESKTLTIAFDPNVPPWSYKDADLNYTGYEFMIAKKLAEDHGLTLEIVETNGANRIPLLLTNRVDLVVAAMSITDERKEVIDFSLPYGGTVNAVSGPPDVAVSSVDDLAGKSVAVARGTISDTQLTAIAPAGANIVRFEDESTTLTSILSGQLDLVAQSTSLNKTIMERDPSIVLEPKIELVTSQHGIGMRKGEDALRAWVNAWIVENTENGAIPEYFQQVHGIPLPQGVVDAVKASES
jgi:polar amino acid transport system substrate-binding protein